MVDIPEKWYFSFEIFLFSLVWVMSMLMVASGLFIWATTINLIYALFYFALYHRIKDIIWIFGAAAAGILLDSFWLNAGVFDTSGHYYIAQHLIPLWGMAIWLALACLYHSFFKLTSLPIWQYALVGAYYPITYYLGSLLEGMTIHSIHVLLYVAGPWGILFACMAMAYHSLMGKV